MAQISHGKTVKYLRAPLDRAHTFQGPGRDLPCTLLRATLYHDGQRAAGFELDTRFEHDVYLAATETHAFDLGPDSRGPIFGGELQSGQPVTITLFLRPELLSSYFSTASAFGAEANQVLEALATQDHPLAQSNAWMFLSVMQEVPGQTFQVGFKHQAYQEMDSHLML